jgi:peptidoglycan-associated lipoprotein
MRPALFIAIITCLSINLAYSQPINTANYETMIATAEEAYANQDYYNALDWYEKAYDESNDRSLTLTIAQLHYLLRDYNRAERWYGRLLNRDKNNEHADKRFIYGKLLKMTGQYPDAIAELQQFVSETYNDSLKTLAESEIVGAQMAMDMPDLMKGLTVENMGRDINSSFSEYSPFFGSNTKELYFSAFDTKEVIVVDESNTDYHAKIYKSVVETVRDKEKWQKPEPLDNNVNRPGVHTTNVSISPDGRTMYFTRATLEGNVIGESKIYYSVGGESWGAAQEVTGVNGDYVAKQAVEGELFGNQVLFFVSDMPGGYGGFDIYYATKKSEGVFADPVNLGDKINTKGNDETPFYRDGTLYFSSNGHPNLGGMDIFFSSWDGSNWSEPANMGKGYNTNVDDLYFSMDKEGYNGFIVSNRPGGRSVKSKTCCNDIYTFEIAQMYADLRAGLFTKDKKVLKGGTMELVEIDKGQRKNPQSKSNEKGNVFGFPLDLEKAYLLIATAEGYYPDSVELNTVGLTESQTFEKRLYLEAKPVPPPEPEYDTITTEKPIVLENILYDFDDDRIKEESEPDLQVVLELMNTYPEMVIELRSHTDNRGEDAYNRNLSQRRAESARRWLMRQGVDRSRIQANGYGESTPQTISAKWAALYDYLNEGDVLTEEFIDNLEGEEQQEQAHSFNRRTEFQILEGPKTIIIKNTIRKKTTTPTQKKAPRRNALPTDPVKISQMSSLYGKKDLTGVPIMHFDERVVDLGTVKKGEKRTHTYEFTNKGDTDLVISIISACDCTTTDYSTDPVKPGGSGKIKVTFDSSKKEENEIIDVDVILENEEPDTGKTIIEMLQYTYNLVK